MISRKKEIMEAVFLILAVLSLAYYMVVIICSGYGTSFAWFWILTGAVFLLLFVLLRYDRTHPGNVPLWGKRILFGLLLTGFAAFLFLFSRVVSGMHAQAPEGLSYLVVLGAKVRDDRPSRALRKRLETALAYAEQNPETMLILSGGQGPDEQISEAACMEKWLTEKGMDPSRLILEDASTDTRENLIYAAEKSGCGESPTGIVTNNFHVYRALRLAESLGYTQASGMAAPTSPAVILPHYMVREAFALAKELVTGNISF